MPRLPQPCRSERMLIARIIIAIGLALMLLVGAWSNSHGENRTGSALCVANGSAATSVTSVPAHHDVAYPAQATADAGLIGACALIVFLLVLVAQHMLRDRSVFTGGPRATASAPPRAGPIRFPRTLTLAQLSISRT